jgi:hypothetical protein
VDLAHLTRDELLERYPTVRAADERRAIRRRLAELDGATPAATQLRPSLVPQLPAGWHTDPEIRAAVLAELGPDRPTTLDHCALAVDVVARRLNQPGRGVKP